MECKNATPAHDSDNRAEEIELVEDKRAELESILWHLCIATTFCLGITVVTMIRDDDPGTITGVINQLFNLCAAFGLAGGLAIGLGLYLKLKSLPGVGTK